MKAQEFLKEVYLFKTLSATDLKWLAEQADERSLVGGDTLFREGDASDALFVIKSGTIEIVKNSSTSSHKLSTLGPKSLLGEIGYVERTARSTTAEATESTTVFCIPYKALDARIKTDAAFGLKVFEALAHQLVKTVQRTTHDLTSVRELKLKVAS